MSQASRSRAKKVLLIVFAVLATLMAFYIIKSVYTYASIRSNNEHMLEYLSNHNLLNISGDESTKMLLAEYADINLIAKILYSLNGTTFLKAIQIIFVCLLAFMIMAIYILDVILIDRFCSYVKRNKHDKTKKHKKPNST